MRARQAYPESGSSSPKLTLPPGADSCRLVLSLATEPSKAFPHEPDTSGYEPFGRSAGGRGDVLTPADSAPRGSPVIPWSRALLRPPPRGSPLPRPTGRTESKLTSLRE